MACRAKPVASTVQATRGVGHLESKPQTSLAGLGGFSSSPKWENLSIALPTAECSSWPLLTRIPHQLQWYVLNGSGSGFLLPHFAGRGRRGNPWWASSFGNELAVILGIISGGPRRELQLHLISGEAEAQQGGAACSRPHSMSARSLSFPSPTGRG